MKYYNNIVTGMAFQQNEFDLQMDKWSIYCYIVQAEYVLCHRQTSFDLVCKSANSWVDDPHTIIIRLACFYREIDKVEHACVRPVL